MTGPRAAIGLSLLCALLLGAIAAPGANAKGTTVFACEKVESGAQFKDEHCTEMSTGVGWTHKEISAGTEINITGTNESTAAATKAVTEVVLTATVSGFNAEIACEKLKMTGILMNKASPALTVTGEKLGLTLTACATRGEWQELGCKVKGAEIKVTNASSTNEEGSMELEIKPETGKPFATIALEGCSASELNKSYELTGTFRMRPEGATLTTTAASTKGLQLAGQQASLTSRATLRAKGFAGQSSLAFTTINTTTAFTCVEEAGAEEGFEDAHCDKATQEEAKVKFVHEEIEAGTETSLTITNTGTTGETKGAAAATLTWSSGGVEAEITCAEVHGSGFLENMAGPPMSVTGAALVEYAKCKMPKPVTAKGKARCNVLEPITATAISSSFVNGVDMGLEFLPKEGTVFATLTIVENESNFCIFKGTSKTEGSAKARAINGGATLVFETGGSELTVGVNSAKLTSTVTVKKQEGNPITLTTTEP